MPDRPYCDTLLHRSRRKTREVMVGPVGIGGDNPLRLQSMTTVATADTGPCVDQILRLAGAGCEIVRLTVPTETDAENLKQIKSMLTSRGCHVPLVADVEVRMSYPEACEAVVASVAPLGKEYQAQLQKGLTEDRWVDIYENRVAARLIDHVLVYLLERIQVLRKLLKVFQDKENYSHAIGGTYLRQRRILNLWGQSLDSAEGRLRAGDRSPFRHWA